MLPERERKDSNPPSQTYFRKHFPLKISLYRHCPIAGLKDSPLLAELMINSATTAVKNITVWLLSHRDR